MEYSLRIDLLLKRENFQQVFEKSLESFWKNYFHKSIVVKWKRSSGGDLLVNPYLNIIYPKNIEKSLLYPIVAEYTFGQNLVKTYLQRLYCAASLSVLFKYLFSKGSIHIHGDTFPESWVIIPGNQTLRIVDTLKPESIVLLKNNFSSEALSREIELKKKYPFIRTPELLELGQGYYKEKRIIALPVSKVSGEEVREDALAEAHFKLKRLLYETRRKVSFNNYLESLKKKVERQFEKIPDTFKPEVSDQLMVVIDSLKLGLCSEVYLSQTHGDWQEGNILVSTGSSLGNEKNLFIIDWEFSGCRSILYDLFTMYFTSRSTKGIGQRVSLYLSGESKELSRWIPIESLQISSDEMSCYYTLWVLEEISFRLDEASIPTLKEVPIGLKLFVDELAELAKRS